MTTSQALRRHLESSVAVTAALLLLCACGGGLGTDAPDDASVADFCASFAKIAQAEDGADVNAIATEMAEVGTPEGISDDERRGFEVFVTALGDVDEDAAFDDTGDARVMKPDRADGDAFLAYEATTCVGPGDTTCGELATMTRGELVALLDEAAAAEGSAQSKEYLELTEEERTMISDSLPTLCEGQDDDTVLDEIEGF